MSELKAATERLTAVVGELERALRAERSEAAEIARRLNIAEARATTMAEETAGRIAELERELEAAIAGDETALAALEARAAKAEREAEAVAAERDKALAEIDTLRDARDGDAQLREEAAQALDAAIGELRVLSRVGAHG